MNHQPDKISSNQSYRFLEINRAFSSVMIIHYVSLFSNAFDFHREKRDTDKRRRIHAARCLQRKGINGKKNRENRSRNEENPKGTLTDKGKKAQEEEKMLSRTRWDLRRRLILLRED